MPTAGAGRLLIALNACALIAVLTFLLAVRPQSSSLHVGAVAGETVVAQHQASYVDRAATLLKRKQVSAAVSVVYQPDPSVARHGLAQAAAFLERVAPIFVDTLPSHARVGTVRGLLPPGLPRGGLRQFPLLSAQEFASVRSLSISLLHQALTWRFTADQRTSTEIGLIGTIPSRITSQERGAVREILQEFLAPTFVPDLTATKHEQQRAARLVAPVRGIVYPGEVVVRRGDLVTAGVMAKLKALGLDDKPGGLALLGTLLLCAIAIGMLLWHMYAFDRTILRNPRLLILIDASAVLAVATAQTLATGHMLLPFFLPIAGAATFAAVLMAPEVCIAMALVLAFLAGWLVAGSFELTMYFFISSVGGVLVVRRVREVRQFLLAGVLIAVLSFAVLLAFSFSGGGFDLTGLEDYALAAAFNGFASATLALGGFALLAGYFGVTTSLQLLELGQPSQPLLRRLMVKAPGTYNHSLIVASMVERAAEEVGANPLVAKLGALYHDAGKVTNPLCFSENQLGMGNIHDELAPHESARLIRGHVTQGQRLARQYKLPRAILDAISEHHGTMAIQYFLHRARQEQGADRIDTSAYRYPGPRPSSKETGLLMLADGCESAVRAANDHSQENIAKIVFRIFQERVEQGQLDECPLTLQDLNGAREAYCAILNGLYHPRVEYPEQEPLRLLPDRHAVSE
ncbi:MAG: HD family phosphohydrolase [Chloroflexota bacterium]